LRIIISFLEWWHWWAYSRDQAKQSCMDLAFMNPYWFLRIRDGRLKSVWSESSLKCSGVKLAWNLLPL
jgi:hypothetical protein